MKPQILFEDAEILVCHKPAGTAVQTASFSAQDMVSILKNHLALEMRKKEKNQTFSVESLVFHEC